MKVKSCKCLNETERLLNVAAHSEKGEIQEQDLISGRTYSNFRYLVAGTTKRYKEMVVLHGYCPFCGKMYSEEDPDAGRGKAKA